MRGAFPFPKCPKCGHVFYEIDYPKDIKWVPNGHMCQMGEKTIEAFDPIPLRGTCKRCGTLVEFAPLIKEENRERVEFT